jgi:D-alanyl-D-alanine carboxypeptidase
MHFRRHLPIIIILFLSTLLSTGGIYAFSRQQESITAKRDQEQKVAFAKIDELVTKHKAEIAAKTAADARAKAEAVAKTKALTEAKAKADAAANAAEAAKQQAAAIQPTGNCADLAIHADPSHIDSFANKKPCIQPLNFAPNDLITVYDATISAKAQANFVALYQAASAAAVPFRVTSSYRSYDNQVATYNYWVSVDGTAGADTVSARPGYSEHQLGLSIDLAAGTCVLECFATTGQYAWLKSHAAAYGFIERYPSGYTTITGYSPEAWHWRYVGPTAAQDMRASGTKTLEQYWGITGGGY